MMHTFIRTWLLSALALATTCTALSAQTYQWAAGIGGKGFDHATGVAFDASGNAYITGSFEDTVDFDPGAGLARQGAASRSAFIAKYSATGAYQWSIVPGGSSSEGLQIAVTPAGKVTVAGLYAGAADFDPGPGTAMRTGAQYGSFFIAQYDVAGKLQWVTSGGGMSVASALTLDPAGNILMAGVLSAAEDFDPGPGTALLDPAAGALFIAKYSPAGSLIWAKNMLPSTGSLSARGIALDGQGNIFLTGSFTGNANINPGPGSTMLKAVGVQDVYLAKFDPSCNLRWAMNVGCAQNATIPKGLAVDPHNGSAYITGNHYASIDLDPGPGTATFTTNGNYNVFLAKYDSAGAYEWAHSLGGASNSGGCDGSSVAIDAARNVLLGGYFSQTVDFDPGAGTATLSSTYPGIFIAKYTSAGSHVWAKGLPARNPKIFNPGSVNAVLAVDGGGNLYAAGTFGDTTDFGMGVAGATRASAGHYDLYVARYKVPVTHVEQRVSVDMPVMVYPNPSKRAGLAVRYVLPEAAAVSIRIVDVSGREVAFTGLGRQPAGSHTHMVGKVLVPGSYVLRLSAGDASVSTRFVVLE